MTEKRNKYQILQPLLLSLMVAIGMVVGYQLDKTDKGELIRIFPGDHDIRIGQVEEVLRFLDSKYLYEPNGQELTDDALQQLFNHLDPYSLYIAPSQLQQVSNNMNGNYKGIGIETIIHDDTLIITKVLPGSPAEVGGMKALDRIVRIDGKDITGENLDFNSFKSHFKDLKESSTLVRIYRKLSRDSMDLELLPDMVETKSVNQFYRINDSTLYVRIDQFVSKTYREFMEVLEAEQTEGRVPQLIIDLRDNPGGYLGEVTKILSQFFDDSEKMLVRTTVRNGRERTYETTGRTFYNINRIVVLINQNSASGSEVLAGALQDHDRALIIGEKSFGKGLVQEQYDLSGGGAVRLTVANYFLPTGRSIQKKFDLNPHFFAMDSVWQNGEQTYLSLQHARLLKGANGIEPDVQVSDGSNSALYYQVFYSDTEFDKQVISFIEKNKELLDFKKEDFVSSYAVDLNSTDWDLLNENYDVLSAEMIQALIKAKIAFYLYDDESVLNILLKQDDYLIKALQQFEKDEWFVEESS